MQRNLEEFLIRFLIKIGLIRNQFVIDAFIFSQIPKDSLRFQAVLQEVEKMKYNESRTFKFDPRDPQFDNLNFCAGLFSSKLKRSVLTNFNIQPLKGIYEIEVVPI